MVATYIGKPGVVLLPSNPDNTNRWKPNRSPQQEVQNRFRKDADCHTAAGSLRAKIMKHLPEGCGGRIGVSAMDGKWWFRVTVWPTLDRLSQPASFTVNRYDANPRKIARQILLLL